MAPRIDSVVSSFIASFQVTDEPRPAVDRLTEMSVANTWFDNPEDSREWAEKKVADFLGRLRREHQSLTQLGRVVPFSFNSSSGYMLQGAAFVEPSDAADTRDAKRRLARVSAYSEFFTGLTPDDFEALCAGVLAILGVQEPHLTAASGDEGIDFYGRLELQALLAPLVSLSTIERQLTAWLVGQAKHYQAAIVSTPDLRGLVGAIELAKGAAFAGSAERFTELAIRVCDPVVYLFMTTGRMSSASWKLLSKSGVVAMDGHMVAAFLAAREVGVKDGELDSDELDRWIASVREQA